jgi:D-galactonate transporter
MTAAAAPAEGPVYAKVSRRLIPLHFVAYIAAYLDRVNVGIAKLGIATDLGFSDTVYGAGAGIFFLGYFLFEVPSNVILERVGAKVWIARIMIGWGVISAGTMLVRTPASFYAMRFLLGVAEAGFFPGIILYLTYWYPRSHRAGMTAAFMTAVAMAGVIGGPISGWILGRLDGAFGLAGWQWLFILEGLPSTLIGIAVLLYLDDGPAKAKWLSQEERTVVLARLEEDERVKRAAGVGRTRMVDAFRDPRVWLLSAVYFGLAMGLYGVSFWLPQIIKESITADPVAIGFISAIPWLVGAVAMTLNGRHSDRTGERRWHTARAALVGGAAFAVSALPGAGGWVGIAAITIATAGLLSAASCFWSLPTALLSGTAAAVGIALINSIGNLAGYASPSLVGRIRDSTHSMVPALSLLAGSVLLSGILTIALGRQRPERAQP